MQKIDCAHSRSAKTPPSSCFRENVNFSTIFVRQTSPLPKSIFSRKQGEGGVFTLRECAQSIPRIKLPLYRPYRENFLSEIDLFGPPITKKRYYGSKKKYFVKNFLSKHPTQPIIVFFYDFPLSPFLGTFWSVVYLKQGIIFLAFHGGM
jgi:hypothetical protein